MVATISTRTHTATHGSLRRSISDYTAGQLSKQDIHQIFAKALETDPECGSAIEEFLDRELHGRRLSATDHKELTAGLQAPPSENIPTETSAGMPDKSGLYHIDDEGTLVLSGDFQPEAAPPLAAPAPGNKAPADHCQDEAKVQGPAGLEVGSILRERFRLDEEVASGSMGLVYRATDLLKLEAGAKSPIVAVKVINPNFANNAAALKSFQNEVANTQHLSHPNIIHLFELDKHDEHFFITMEWLEGESLDTLLDRSMGSALPPIQAYAIIEQLCDALVYAHARNVVHADIKPGNVFLTKPGELKLIDFGIAHLGDAAELSKNQDKEVQTIALTPAYASCEALEKDKPTAQDDLYSLACLVYRLLSGRRAFGSLTALQAESQGIELVPIGGMSESRWDALAKALSFRRGDRQSDVKTFAAEFGQRSTPRKFDIEPEIDDVVHTETITLRSLPEGVGVNEAEVVDPEFSDTTTLNTLPGDAVIVQPEAELDDMLSAYTTTSDSPVNRIEQVQSESVAQDIVFADTVALDAPAENLESAVSDTVNLDETAPLGAVSFQVGVDLLGTDVIGSAPGMNSVDAASADTEELGVLPEPINFFDEDSDDSAFVPLEESQAPVAAKSPGTQNAKVEILPGDCSFMEGGTAERPIAGNTNSRAPQVPVRQEPARKPLPNLSVKPAAKPIPQAAEQPVGKPATQDSSQIVAALTGARLSTQTATSISILDRIVHATRAKPLQIGGGIAVGIAVLAIGAGWLFSSGDASTTISSGQAAQLNAANPNGTLSQQPQAGGSDAAMRQKAVVPAELFFTRNTRSESDQAAMPTNSADSGIATGNAVVAVPLSLANQSARGAAPNVADNSPGNRLSAVGASQSLGETTNTAGYMIALNSLARQALAAGNLVEPADASVIVWLDKMRASDPNSMETREIEEQLVVGLLQRAAQSAAKLDVDSAVRLTDTAEKYGADSTRLMQVQQLITKSRMQRERETTASAETDLVQQDSVNPNADELSVEIPVPLSAIEFTRYSEPVFPDQLINTRVEGWVDVSFTIGVDGETRNVDVTGSDLPAEFVPPSITVVENWGFKPYVHNGEVVPVNSAVRLHYSN